MTIHNDGRVTSGALNGNINDNGSFGFDWELAGQIMGIKFSHSFLLHDDKLEIVILDGKMKVSS